MNHKEEVPLHPYLVNLANILREIHENYYFKIQELSVTGNRLPQFTSGTFLLFFSLALSMTTFPV